MGKNVWVSPKGEKWSVKTEGSSKADKLFRTQSEAAAYGREMAQRQRSELIIQRPNGQIRSKDSFGNDPCPPRDKEH